MKKIITVVTFCITLFGYVCHGVEIDWTKPETIDLSDSTLLKQFDVEPQRFLVDGWQAYQDQEYEKATRHYLAYLYHVKNDSGNMYNLACCYGLLGNAEMAAIWVRKSVEAGYADFAHLKQDVDFEKVRNAEIFKKTVTELEEKQKKAKGDPGEIMMVPSQSMIPLYVKKPVNFDPEKTYPLVLGLHGYGGIAENYAQIWDRNGISIDFIYVAMEAPYAFSLGSKLGTSWFLLMDHEKYPDEVAAAGEMTFANILEGLKVVKSRFNIGKVYLTGFSQGGGLTYMVGLKNPELFEAIFPFGGWIETDVISEKDLEKAKDLPVIIVHGKSDTMVEYKLATDALALLKKHDYTVELVDFDGGHTVPKVGLEKIISTMKGSK